MEQKQELKKVNFEVVRPVYCSNFTRYEADYSLGRIDSKPAMIFIRDNLARGVKNEHAILEDVKEDDDLILEHYHPGTEVTLDDLCYSPGIKIIHLKDIASIAKIDGDRFQKIYGVPIEWIKQMMMDISSDKGIHEQAEDTWRHSKKVYELALEIAGNSNQEYRLHILEKGCFIHDIGRMFTGSPASKELEPGILHGFYGANFFRGLRYRSLLCDTEAEEMEIFARICERHFSGTGFTRSTLAGMRKKHVDLLKIHTPLPLLAEGFYEHVIGYADWRTHAVKKDGVFVPVTVSEEEAMEKTKSYDPSPEQIKEILALCSYIGTLTKNKIR